MLIGTDKFTNMMDYFPTIKWIPFVLLGIFSGRYFFKNIKNVKPTFLSKISKNSLNLYIFHFTALILIFNENLL